MGGRFAAKSVPPPARKSVESDSSLAPTQSQPRIALAIRAAVTFAILRSSAAGGGESADP